MNRQPTGLRGSWLGEARPQQGEWQGAAPERLQRRRFLFSSGLGIGAAALYGLLQTEDARAASSVPIGPHFAPRAKRVIFLHQSGAPSQIDLFDHKPTLESLHGEELPESIRRGQRLTAMTARQDKKPVTQSLFRFAKQGSCGADVSELLPYTAKIVDELCFIKSLHTEAINHDPAITFIQTGSEQPGRPSMGAWLSYGLGSASQDWPAFTVFISGGQPGDQPLFNRLWGSGFLPSQHQGVKFRGRGDPVLYLSDPPGMTRDLRRRMVQGIGRLNAHHFHEVGDPEIEARTAQFELAFRMQDAVPRLADISSEPASVLELYGPDVRTPGSYAWNCLMARRLAEQGVRFIQLYHRDWDHHTNLPARIRLKCRETDQPSAGLVMDLKQRGMLKDTLVIWSGEFGRTSYCQGELTADNYGRDHHPRCFTVWLAGGGIKSGFSYGATDDFSYNVIQDPVHVHDLQATLLHCLGLDHTRLTYRFQGRDYRLTDIGGRVVEEIFG